MTREEPWYIKERAEWFASLVLTKHHDVKVQPYAGTDMALDLRVEILKDSKPTMRYFGVEVVPYMDLPNAQGADRRVLSHLGRNPSEAAHPLCVFVIGVRKPEGIYRWAAEPVIEDGRAVLRRDVGPNWQPLDEEGTARLLKQVNAWYDALNGSQPPKRRGREPKAPGLEGG